MLTALFNFAMKVIQFVVEGQPVPKGRPRFSQKTGRGYTPQKTRQAEQKIVKAYKQEYADVAFPEDVALELDCRFYLQIPKYKMAHADEIEGAYVLKKPDSDNLLKTVADSMNGVAYPDDKCIVVVRAEKRYSKYPRTEITIKDITP